MTPCPVKDILARLTLLLFFVACSKQTDPDASSVPGNVILEGDRDHSRWEGSFVYFGTRPETRNSPYKDFWHLERGGSVREKRRLFFLFLFLVL